MRQIFQLFLFDVKRNMKNFMGMYMLIVPMLILLILRFFLPSVENTSTTIAVVSSGPNQVETELVDFLDKVTDIKKYDSIKQMKEKLRSIGSCEGLYYDEDKNQLISLLDGSSNISSTNSVTAGIIRQYYKSKQSSSVDKIVSFKAYVPSQLSKRTKISPVATIGGSIFQVFMIVILAFIIGLGIVNDKEEGTDKAIRVSPANRIDYFLGKSIQPFLISAIYTLIALSLLGLIGVNIFQTYIILLSSFSITLIFGLLLGALGKNETETIAYGKLISMIVMLALFGATLLPDSWEIILWWNPFYWVFDIYEEIFTQSAKWITVFWKSAVILLLSGIYFLLLRKSIIKGLSHG